MNNSNPLTVTLWNGIEVMAKLYEGEPYAVTYANRTQAERRAASMGNDWDVYHWGRPFFVGRKTK